MNKIKTVKSSNLPKSIRKEAHHFPSKGNSLYENEGPKLPNAGPTFPKLEAATPMADSKSNPKDAKTTAPKIKDNI